MIATAWNNGTHLRNGRGYGFKVSIPDRDAFFNKEWDSIVVEIEEFPDPIEISIEKDAFWSESSVPLTSLAVGKWLIKNGMSAWPIGNSPVFVLEPVKDNQFKIMKARKGHKSVS